METLHWRLNPRDLYRLKSINLYMSLYAGNTEHSVASQYSKGGEMPGPTLTGARFTSVTDGDNKDHDTGLYVYVFTKDERTRLAQIENADNSNKDATEYNDGSEHMLDLALISPGSTKADCNGFHYKVGIKANGNDKWKVATSRVQLVFSDNTELDANSGYFELESKGSQYVETGPFVAPAAKEAA